MKNGTRKSRKLPPVQAEQLPPALPLETVQLTAQQFRACLQALATQAGSIVELAARLGVSGQFLGDVIAGRKHAGRKLLGCFGAKLIWIVELPVDKGGGNGKE